MRTAGLARIALRWSLPLTLGITVGAGAVHVTSQAQPQNIKRTELNRSDLTGVEGKEVVLASIEAQPGAAFPRHFHHGDEFVYVMDGALEISIADRSPASPKAGESLHIPREKVHSGKVVSATPAKILTVHIVDKGKPLAELVKD